MLFWCSVCETAPAYLETTALGSFRPEPSSCNQRTGTLIFFSFFFGSLFWQFVLQFQIRFRNHLKRGIFAFHDRRIFVESDLHAFFLPPGNHMWLGLQRSVFALRSLSDVLGRWPLFFSCLEIAAAAAGSRSIGAQMGCGGGGGWIECSRCINLVLSF